MALGALFLLTFVAWRIISLYDLAALIIPTSQPTTRISADSGTGTWAQYGKDPGGTNFTRDESPAPATVKWTFSTGMEWSYETQTALVSPPSVSGNEVFLSTEDGRILSLDADTGRTLWQYVAESPSRAAPVVAGELVIAALRSGEVVALNRETGALVWKRELGSLIYSHPVVANGSVYVGTIDGAEVALDAATGEPRWTFQTGERIVSRVAHGDGTVAVVSEGSIVYVVDDSTGRRRLIFDTERRRNNFGGAAIHDGSVYFSSDGGIIWAIDQRASTRPLGRSIFYWKVKLFEGRVLSSVPIQKGTLWVWRVGGDLLKTPAVGPEAVYFSSARGTVLARDLATGERVWTADLGTELSSPPSVAGSTLLVGAANGQVFGLDTASGLVKWNFQVCQGSIAEAPILVGGAIYVVSRDGSLYALSE